jgi:plastocyanin
LRPRQNTGGVQPVTNRANTAADGPRVKVKASAPESIEHAASAPVSTLAFEPAPAAVAGGSTHGVAASISGRVLLRGNAPAETRIQLDAMCGRLHPAPMFTRHFVVDRAGGLANVFVYIKEGAPTDEGDLSGTPLLDNVNCVFEPYVLGVRAGQPLKFRNSDAVLHNVHMIPAAGSRNREINMGLPVRGATTSRTLEAPEMFVKVKCDVHPWMFAYIGVMAHRWFAVTDRSGGFALPPGLPAGRYTIAAVHQKAGEQTREIVLEARTEPVTFTFESPLR